jgi:hypothetical protein
MVRWKNGTAYCRPADCGSNHFLGRRLSIVAAAGMSCAYAADIDLTGVMVVDIDLFLISGWVDNLNGPTGLIAGASRGVIRSVYCM